MEVGIEFVLYRVGMARLLLVFLKILERQGRGKQSLGKERGDPLFTVLWRKRQKMAFNNSTYFITVGSFTADSGLLYPAGGVRTTPQRTRFRDVQHARIMATV